MKCFTDHCARCAMHEEEPGFFIVVHLIFSMVSHRVARAFFFFLHGLSPFLARRFLQPARASGFFVQHVAMVIRESVVRTMD